MGLHSERLLQQLLTQDHKKPLDDLFHLAQTVEAAEKESFRWADENSTAMMNKWLKKKSVLPAQAPKKQSTGEQSNAQAVVEIIFVALVNSEMQSVTGVVNQATSRRCVVHSLLLLSSQYIPHADSAVVTLSPTQEAKDIPPIFQLLNLPSFARQLQLVVDSASPITFDNSKTWNDLDKPQLQPTDRVLGAFKGQPIHPMGYFQTEVSCEDQPQDPIILPIYVSHNRINILGCDGLTKLNISISPDKFGTVAAIEQESGMPKALQDVMNINDEIFKPELGHCITVKATLILQEGANPKFCKPRKLPFALKPVVGDELDRLEKQGVIEKVSHAEWATPIVVVRKPGGRI